MRRIPTSVALVVTAGALWALPPGDRTAQADEDHGRKVIIRDDCDPDDPAWADVGGCERKAGDVTLDEFNDELSSPLSLSVVGHQAWRNDPPYLEIEVDDRVRVGNQGGRPHTFTRVENFGGGVVPDLNQGLTPAPECATAETLPAGARTEVHGLEAGDHRFQCCIHPWMRALITVKPEVTRPGASDPGGPSGRRSRS